MVFGRAESTHQTALHIHAGQRSENVEESEEFAVEMKVEKTAALSHSMDLLKAGIDEAKVCVSSSLVMRTIVCV